MNAENKKGWPTSTTGGVMISVAEAARQLGVSTTHVRNKFLEWELYPAIAYNPIQGKQYIKFFAADVLALKERLNPNAATSPDSSKTDQETQTGGAGPDEKKIVSSAAA